ncbi:hypothetical protein SMXD51_05053 [Ligilactobacillus salivarius SMXD51]|uniref:Uncharacterized protein n=1 Tax=Ligilactobacillus salivarius SMXD51 TaxID=1108963 RepID=H7FXZ4_9LACO|nr:hypothetical protein SMXD51_05053 [Ligilactobacillus salivarius SMXD51]
MNKTVSKSLVYSNWRIMIIKVNKIRTIMDSIVDKVLIFRLSKESKLYIKNNILVTEKSIFC